MADFYFNLVSPSYSSSATISLEVRRNFGHYYILNETGRHGVKSTHLFLSTASLVLVHAQHIEFVILSKIIGGTVS